MSEQKSLAMMPWFPRDFISATRHLALAERGAYRELLDHQWELGSLPNDETRLARILGITIEEFRSIWAVIKDKFESVDGDLLNKRLEELRKEAFDRREKKIDGANMTNAKRYADRDAKRHDIASPPSPSPSPSINHKKKDKKDRSHFVPPTLDQVLQYMQNKKRPDQASRFFLHYESNGWKVGKNPMKKWEAAAAAWLTRDFDNGGKHIAPPVTYRTIAEVEAEERARELENAKH